MTTLFYVFFAVCLCVLYLMMEATETQAQEKAAIPVKSEITVSVLPSINSYASK